ncbi:GyrI-like domain-containing protein [Cytobacillus purgationiresistens]|uniref:Transcriptional regulator YdeE n=1 Tax=Cytobacillus purgationiresistens TaxID=863449 RepID=A0ABU0AKA3_9BACI|nr:AraC family transcriptional regulator [Cytobacillus purgationiresistens]MDQ0271682.1 putative transcriptional regulator YdeE [Cytobacillus purgationiresistens]
MECKKVKQVFKLVGIKGHGSFEAFGVEVPALAQQFLTRSKEVESRSSTEIALFEPKKNINHLEGNYYVGLIVNDTLNEVPSGMEYIEKDQHYVTARGKITDISNLHLHLLNWAKEQNYDRDLDSYIVETYHPVENSEEEVEVYLPIHS